VGVIGPNGAGKTTLMRVIRHDPPVHDQHGGGRGPPYRSSSSASPMPEKSASSPSHRRGTRAGAAPGAGGSRAGFSPRVPQDEGEGAPACRHRSWRQHAPWSRVDVDPAVPLDELSAGVALVVATVAGPTIARGVTVLSRTERARHASRARIALLLERRIRLPARRRKAGEPTPSNAAASEGS
jgi:hypothetical protein